MKKKIITNINASKIISGLKKRGKKISMCHGVFDLLHVGHIDHFVETKSFSDILIVSITKDQYVNKGPNRPVFNLENRIKFLINIDKVDYVFVSPGSSAIESIKILKPNFYVKGPDYKNFNDDITKKIQPEINEVKKYGGKVVFTTSATQSSSKLLNSNFEIYNEKQKKFISNLKKKITTKEVLKKFKDFKKLNILVIGEMIIDQYNFCNAIGKSGKDPVLMLNELYSEKYIGGVAAIARNLSSFCKKITILTAIGEKKEHLKFIEQKLEKNIKFDYITKKNSPTIIKTKFLDKLNLNKLFGTYKFNDDLVSLNEENNLIKKFKKYAKSHDLVLVSDYGHGMIGNKFAQIVCRLSPFLSVNAQVNAANIGYHGLHKYNNLKLIIINESELRQEFRSKHDNVKKLMIKLSKLKKMKYLVVTRGINGAILLNCSNKKFFECPAFANNAVDKIGSGDAMMSIISLFLKTGNDELMSLFASSLAAAQNVQTLANKKSLDDSKFLKSIDHMLK